MVIWLSLNHAIMKSICNCFRLTFGIVLAASGLIYIQLYLTSSFFLHIDPPWLLLMFTFSNYEWLFLRKTTKFLTVSISIFWNPDQYPHSSQQFFGTVSNWIFSPFAYTYLAEFITTYKHKSQMKSNFIIEFISHNWEHRSSYVPR